MSQALQEQTGTDHRRSELPVADRRPGRLIALIVVLGLLLGAAAGWTAFTVLSEGADTTTEAEARSLDAQRQRLEKAAEHFAQRAEAHRQEVERLRWEAQADRYAPGWRDR